MKKIFLIALLIFLGYYGLKFASGYSLAKQVSKCAAEVDTPNRLKSAKTPAEKEIIILSMYDCVEKNLAFPGSLGYDKEKFRASAADWSSTE